MCKPLMYMVNGQWINLNHIVRSVPVLDGAKPGNAQLYVLYLVNGDRIEVPPMTWHGFDLEPKRYTFDFEGGY